MTLDMRLSGDENAQARTRVERLWSKKENPEVVFVDFLVRANSQQLVGGQMTLAAARELYEHLGHILEGEHHVE